MMLPYSAITAMLMLALRRDALVISAANRWHVSPVEMVALSHVENRRGIPNAISRKGAIGLLQVMPGWVNTYQKDCGKVPNLHTMADTVAALSVPTYNICIGTHIYRSYLRQCHSVVYCARARYNGAKHFTKSAKEYNRRINKERHSHK